MRRLVRPAATLLIACIALVLLARAVDVRAAMGHLADADPRWIAVAAAALALNLALKSLRWRLLMGHEGARQPLPRVIGWLLVGQGINNLTPVRLGEIARATLAGQSGVSRASAFGSILLEKFIEMAFYALGLLIVSLSLPLPPVVTAQMNGPRLLLLMLLVLLLGLGGLRLLAALPSREGRRGRLLGELRRWRENLARLRARGGLLRLGATSAAIWLMALLVNHALLRAFDLRVPLVTALLLVVVLQGGLALPLVGMTLGPFEAICLFTLSLVGVESARALSFALVLHALLLIPAVGGLTIMARHRLSLVRVREWLWTAP